MENEFEKYLNGEMRGAARADFENRLAADPALRVTLETERKILDGFQFLRIRQRVGEAIEANRRIRNRRIWVMSLLFFGLIGLVGLYFLKNKNQTEISPADISSPKTTPAKTPEPEIKTTPPDTFFQKNLPEKTTPPPPDPKPTTQPPNPKSAAKPIAANISKPKNTNSTVSEKSKNQYALALDFHRLPGGFSMTRGVGDSDLPSNDFEKALAEFDSGRFKICISMLQNLEKSTAEEVDQLRLLRAHALFLDGQTGLAERDFAVLSEKSDSIYQFNAEWHRLLCHLANQPEDKTGVQKLLKKILENEEHPFSGQAREINLEIGY